LQYIIDVTNGDTIKFDALQLHRGDRRVYYYTENTTEGSGGSISADSYAEDDYDVIGFDLDAITVQHPWKRVEEMQNVWQALKSIAWATAPLYFGMDENNTLKMRSILKDSFTDPVPNYVLDDTDIRRKINVSASTSRSNWVVIQGMYVRKTSWTGMLWSAASSGIIDMQANGEITETISDGEAWPTDDVGPFYARFGDDEGGNYDMQEEEMFIHYMDWSDPWGRGGSRIGESGPPAYMSYLPGGYRWGSMH
jgi:hypothetical protein